MAANLAFWNILTRNKSYPRPPPRGPGRGPRADLGASAVGRNAWCLGAFSFDEREGSLTVRFLVGRREPLPCALGGVKQRRARREEGA